MLLLEYPHVFSDEKIQALYTDRYMQDETSVYYFTEDVIGVSYQLHTYDKTQKEIGKTSFSVELLDYESTKDTRFYQNPLTIAEAVAFISEMTNELSGRNTQFAIGKAVYLHSPLRYYDEKTDEYGEYVRDKGAYEFTLAQEFNGIPIDIGVCSTFAEQGKCKEDVVLRNTFGVNGYVISHEEYILQAILLDEKKRLYDDMPVCSIEKIINTCERAIQEGKIREIFDVNFGYVLYFPPEGPAEELRDYQYWAVPSWVVRCRYVESPKTKEYGLDKQGPYNRLSSYVSLVINAQTGEIIDPGNTARDRCYAPKILKQ